MAILLMKVTPDQDKPLNTIVIITNNDLECSSRSPCECSTAILPKDGQTADRVSLTFTLGGVMDAHRHPAAVELAGKKSLISLVNTHPCLLSSLAVVYLPWSYQQHLRLPPPASDGEVQRHGWGGSNTPAEYKGAQQGGRSQKYPQTA
ncbi:hypothetical protein Q9966_002310 [Columba livia]|nr:hypothetical protein Q9966_002310 [Columba livia]